VTTVTNQLAAATIGGAVWDIVRASHTTSGTFGEVSTPADIAAAVRDVDNSSPAASSVGAVLNATKALLPTALVGGKMDSHVNDMATDSFTAAALKTDAVTEIVNAIKAAVVEGSLTWNQVLQVLLAGVAGKSTVSGNYRDQADTKNRIAATVSDSHRTAVTLNVD
jgi:hypothetical protein